MSARLNVHLYPSPLTYESRMLRVTSALMESGVFDAIELVGTQADGLPGEEPLDGGRSLVRLPAEGVGLSRVRRLVGLRRWGAAVEERYRDADVACINAHSLTVLPLAARLASRTGARLIYDTHELETETASASPLRRSLARQVERRYIGRADHTFVVSSGIETWYRETYGLTSVTTIKNYPVLRDRTHSTPSVPLRAVMDVPSEGTLLLYLGKLSPGRGLERLVSAFHDYSTSSQFLALVGFGPLEVSLRAQAIAGPAWERIQLLPPVPPHDVAALAAQADVGVALIQPVSLSYRLSLPNKALESLAGGIPVLASDLPDLAAELDGDSLGWTIEPTEAAVARWLRTVTPAEIARKRARADLWGLSHHWGLEAARMVSVYKSLLNVRGDL